MMPTSAPRSSTTGTRRTCSRPMSSMTSFTESLAVLVRTSEVMMWPTDVVAPSRPSATARTAMSRSVRTPTSRLELSDSTTGTTPMFSFFMSRAASASVVSGVTHVGFLDMMSCAFIAPPGFGSRWPEVGKPRANCRESGIGNKRSCSLLADSCVLLLLAASRCYYRNEPIEAAISHQLKRRRSIPDSQSRLPALSHPHRSAVRDLTGATKKDILALARESNVRFLRLQFTDILGVNKNVELPASQFEKALDGDIMFDGSSIEGFVRIEESDMLLSPDLSTFQLFPWGDTENRVARLICDINTPDGQPFDGDPRAALKRQIARAAALGYTMNAGMEAEFFMFKPGAEGEATTITNDVGGYFDLAPADLGEDARRAMVDVLERMGFE